MRKLFLVLFYVAVRTASPCGAAGQVKSEAAPALANCPPTSDRPVVRIETAVGLIDVELPRKQAPITACNFLSYVEAGFYNGGSFFRTVRADNQHDKPVKISVIQADVADDKAEKLFPAIPLENTKLTGIRHRDGTLSMARDQPDSATSSFSICIGDQPSLDFGGRRNPDGQGFAAFGKVIRGMTVVRRIRDAHAIGEQLSPPVRIKRLYLWHT